MITGIKQFILNQLEQEKINAWRKYERDQKDK
jgi:hypothetical protein